MNLELGRAIADAVLYEGYLLYPYRASSSKNQTRWQFGVVSPPGAADAGFGEQPSMTLQCVLTESTGQPRGAGEMVVHLRFLHLQRRQLHDVQDREVEELLVDATSWTSWDEAVERELEFGFSLDALEGGDTVPVRVAGSEDVEALRDASGVEVGRVVRRTWPLSAELRLAVAPVAAGGGYRTFELNLDNTTSDAATSKETAIRRSLIGAHVLVEARGFGFVSMVDPPADAAELVAGCTQDRCWPVLTGAPGDTDLLLGSPIILYDYPEIAAESDGSLFDGTEIDEILTLRVMTMTEQEKAEARATDPRAAEIIDRCDQMTPETLQQMHGILRNPHAEEAVPMLDPPWEAHSEPQSEPQWPGISDVRNLEPTSFETGDAPWWSPEADEAVQPGLDAVLIDGVSVARDSLVRVHPSRRADAQDLFFDDQVARVTAVLSDVDGGTHVALVLFDDPAADIYDLSGRYWYFDPDEVTPLSPEETRQVQAQREEIRP